MVRWANVSRSGYYAWRSRKPSLRDKGNDELLGIIKQIHQKSNKTYGSTRIVREVRKRGIKANHKRIERIMKEHGIRGKACRKYKATTYSDHDMPVAANILGRNFAAEHLGPKMVGVAMDSRMTKKLVMDALQDAINHTADVNGCILHSDRGSPYCSKAYVEMAGKAGFIMSMSRKGNCWDNAPMESFWGTLK